MTNGHRVKNVMIYKVFPCYICVIIFILFLLLSPVSSLWGSDTNVGRYRYVSFDFSKTIGGFVKKGVVILSFF